MLLLCRTGQCVSSTRSRLGVSAGLSWLQKPTFEPITTKVRSKNRVMLPRESGPIIPTLNLLITHYVPQACTLLDYILSRSWEQCEWFFDQFRACTVQAPDTALTGIPCPSSMPVGTWPPCTTTVLRLAIDDHDIDVPA